MAPRAEADSIEVVYARPERQRVVVLPLTAGLTVLEAVRASGLLEEFALDPADLPLGIHGRKADGGRLLRAGDRVEIYRPLAADPREARRRSAPPDGAGSRRARPRSG